MRTCSYCGGGYSDDVVQCPIDHTSLVSPTAEAPGPATDAAAWPSPDPFLFSPILAADRAKDLVTLLRCRTLAAADFAVATLEAAGITAFIPDRCIVQTIGLNLNWLDYIRVQVKPDDYEGARTLLEEAKA